MILGSILKPQSACVRSIGISTQLIGNTEKLANQAMHRSGGGQRFREIKVNFRHPVMAVVMRHEGPHVKYLISVKTAPDRIMDDQAILSLRAEAQALLPCVEIWRAGVEDPLDDAFIDSQTLRDEIADRTIDQREFASYCNARNLSAFNELQEIEPTSAQRFLISLWGQGVFTVAFPVDEGASRTAYARLVEFARERDLQLLSVVPGAHGRIDLNEPGTLPPGWHSWVR